MAQQERYPQGMQPSSSSAASAAARRDDSGGSSGDNYPVGGRGDGNDQKVKKVD